MSVMRTMTTRDVTPGASAPLGATVLAGPAAKVVPLDAIKHRTHHYWHVFVPDLRLRRRRTQA
jgi:glycogen operon protein